jgi:hypothetical protein
LWWSGFLCATDSAIVTIFVRDESRVRIPDAKNHFSVGKVRFTKLRAWIVPHRSGMAALYRRLAELTIEKDAEKARADAEMAWASARADAEKARTDAEIARASARAIYRR